jgi:Ca2+-binding EF-hand superfamily protein
VNGTNPSSLGRGNVFGEGAVLFNRAHGATVIASGGAEEEASNNNTDDDNILECWVVPAEVFRNYVLHSENMIDMFQKHAHRADESGEPYITMDEFVKSCRQQAHEVEAITEGVDAATGLDEAHNQRERESEDNIRIANTYSILRKAAEAGNQQIRFVDYCIFHLIMARPDPEVDIAFQLIDRDRKGYISLDDFKASLFSNIDTQSEFFKRHFGPKGTNVIQQIEFPEFLVDYQREMGRQAYLFEAATNGTSQNFVKPEDFIRVLKTSCGWRLPPGVVERLEAIYCLEPIQAAETTAMVAVAAEKLKGSSAEMAAQAASASILANMSRRAQKTGKRHFVYTDFLAFQEVLGQLPGICNLIRDTCDIKGAAISTDDFKVANRAIGLGGKMSRRQVDIVFQLFDMDRDGYISPADAASVMGVDFVHRVFFSC